MDNPLPVWLYSIRASPVEMLTPKMGVAVGISLISSLRADIHVIEVRRLLSLIFPLPVWSHSIFMSRNGMLKPKNVGVIVGISLISCLGAQIHAFEF